MAAIIIRSRQIRERRRKEKLGAPADMQKALAGLKQSREAARSAMARNTAELSELRAMFPRRDTDALQRALLQTGAGPGAFDKAVNRLLREDLLEMYDAEVGAHATRQQQRASCGSSCARVCDSASLRGRGGGAPFGGLFGCAITAVTARPRARPPSRPPGPRAVPGPGGLHLGLATTPGHRGGGGRRRARRWLRRPARRRARRRRRRRRGRRHGVDLHR